MPADVDPGPSIGLMQVKPSVYTEAHPTMELRLIQRGPVEVEMVHSTPMGGYSLSREKPRPRILQQRWAIITFERIDPIAHAIPIKRETEWRDVPLVEE